jgi:hypothetical protein
MEIIKKVMRRRKKKLIVRKERKEIGKKIFNLLLVSNFPNISPRVLGLMEPSKLVSRGLGK